MKDVCGRAGHAQVRSQKFNVQYVNVRGWPVTGFTRHKARHLGKQREGLNFGGDRRQASDLPLPNLPTFPLLVLPIHGVHPQGSSPGAQSTRWRNQFWVDRIPIDRRVERRTAPQNKAWNCAGLRIRRRSVCMNLRKGSPATSAHDIHHVAPR